MSAHTRNAHCSFCGAPFPDVEFPRTCAACGNTTYVNPLPVAVLILPVGGGVLLVRRSLADGRGKLALPGGFITLGESWQAAAARELQEETAVVVDPATIELFDVQSAADGTLLVFGTAAALRPSDLPPFVPNAETAERLVTPDAIELAFPLHTRALQAFFAGRPRRR
jgi:ADP-ribose pyrophosphatase YjhB (NUDIX family)